MAHEVAGVLIATVVALAFISAIQPNSQMAKILSASAGGWSGILGATGGRSVAFPGGVTVGAAG